MRSQFLTVLSTELKDHSRDRRSVMAALAYALFGPVLLLAMFHMIASQIESRVAGDKPAILHVIGAANAPILVAELERAGIAVTRRDTPAATAAAAAGGDGIPGAVPALDGADALLLIPADYPELYRAGEPAEVILYRDERRQSSTLAASFVARAIQAHGAEVAQTRLIARGVAAETLMPLRVVDANVAGVGGMTLQMATLLLYFFVMAPFFTGMSVAIDTAAGERERKSLAPLLVQPVDPRTVILGKWLNASLFSTVGTLLTVVLGMNLLKLAPLEKLQITLPLDLVTQVQMVAVLVPLALAITAVQVTLALTAKSFKEAQTYISLMSILPVALSFGGSMGGQEPEGAILFAPVLGHIELLRGLVADGVVDPVRTLGVGLTCFAIVALALWQCTRVLKSERVLGAA
ncbi:MAG: hypothetical protein RLY86_2447 [Pseudomonadota bacterium]|jgi:sodium transport system permease protein